MIHVYEAWFLPAIANSPQIMDKFYIIIVLTSITVW